MGYSRYAWVGNKISENDMTQLYNLKIKTKKRINEMVAEAVRLYLSQKEGLLEEKQTNTFSKGDQNVQKSTKIAE